MAVWAPEFGTLTRLTSLWECKRTDLPIQAGLEADSDWLSATRSSHVLVPRRPVRVALLGAPVIEMRTYATHDGQVETFVNALLQALPNRETYSLNAGVWTTRERDVDLVYHLWTYESLAQREAVREAVTSDDGWMAYRASIRPMLRAMKAVLFTPVKL